MSGVLAQTVFLLVLSNVFMTFARYAHPVFVLFAVFYMKQPLKLDYLGAALCIMGAVFFFFRSP